MGLFPDQKLSFCALSSLILAALFMVSSAGFADNPEALDLPLSYQYLLKHKDLPTDNDSLSVFNLERSGALEPMYELDNTTKGSEVKDWRKRLNNVDERTFNPFKEYYDRFDGGGGDILLCPVSQDQEEPAHYTAQSLDLALNLTETISPIFSRSSSCSINLDIIALILSEKNPILALGLKDFLADMKRSPEMDLINGKVPARRMFWPSLTDLFDLKDEHLDADEAQLLCPGAQIENVFIRKPLPVSIAYYMNPDRLRMIENDPITCSSVVIHEWLRDVFTSAHEIRAMNNYLHSERFFLEEFDYSLLPEDSRSQWQAAKDDGIEIYHELNRIHGSTYDSPDQILHALNFFPGTYFYVDDPKQIGEVRPPQTCKIRMQIEDSQTIQTADGPRIRSEIKLDNFSSCGGFKPEDFMKFVCLDYHCQLNTEVKHRSEKACKVETTELHLGGFYNLAIMTYQCDGAGANYTFAKDGANLGLEQFLKHSAGGQ